MLWERIIMIKLKYFLPSEVTSMTAEELAMQGTLGLQSCKTKEDAKNILLDMYELGKMSAHKEIKKVKWKKKN